MLRRVFCNTVSAAKSSCNVLSVRKSSCNTVFHRNPRPTFLYFHKPLKHLPKSCRKRQSPTTPGERPGGGARRLRRLLLGDVSGGTRRPAKAPPGEHLGNHPKAGEGSSWGMSGHRKLWKISTQIPESHRHIILRLPMPSAVTDTFYNEYLRSGGRSTTYCPRTIGKSEQKID